jgi:PAS domain S-box-containing protein
MIPILYVDDEPLLLELCSLFLQRSGEFSVTTTPNPLDALHLIREGDFSAVVTDYEMPEMNGIELLKAIKVEFPDIPVIIFTGRGREEVVIEALNNGADFYLQKGGDPKSQFAELIHKIKLSVRRRLAEEEICRKNLELESSYEQIAAAQEEFKSQYEEIEYQAKLLAEDEEKFRTVSHFTYDWEYWLSPSGEFRFVSPSCERISGYTGEEFIQDPSLFTRIVYEEDREIIQSILSALADQSISLHRIEYRIIAKGGTKIWIGHECLRVYGSDGRYLGLRGSCSDITMQKQYEADLIGAEKEWEYIFQAIGTPAVILDGEHRIIHANNEVLKKTGMSIKELRKKYCWEVFHSPHDTKPPQNCPFELLRNFGTSTPVKMEMEAFGEIYLVSCTPIFDETGALSRVIHIATNITRQREEEEELRTFAEILDNIPGIILISDSTGAIVYANNTSLEFYGYNKEDVFSFNLQDLGFSKEKVHRLLRPEESGLDGSEGNRVSFELPYQKPDGSVITLMIYTRTIQWKDKPGLLSIALDISTQKQAQEDVCAKEQHYRLLAENTTDVIWTISLEGIFTSISPSVFQLLGYTPEEIVDHNFIDFITADSQFLATEKLDALKSSLMHGESVQPETLEIEQIHKDGTRIWTEVSYRLYLDECHQSSGIIGVTRNISLRKKTQKHVYQLGNILDASLNEIYIFDADTFRFIEVNRGAKTNLGYSMEELMDLTPLDIKPEMNREQFLRLIEPLKSGESEIITFYTVHLRKNGSLYPVEVHLQMMHLQEQMVFVAVILDISERRRAEEALDEANHKLRLLTGLTRHDILNQLTAVEGYLYLLMDEGDINVIMEYAKHAERVCERIKSTIIFTREYEMFGSVSGGWIQISPLIDSATQEVQLQQVRLENLVSADLVIFADPIIRKVFSTLLENAIRHGGSITTVRFSIQPVDDSLVIICEDDGVGIKEDDKAFIFEHGYGKNTGIGLFLTKEILSITHLSIRECGQEGKGSRFEITVPAGKFMFVRDIPNKNGTLIS